MKKKRTKLEVIKDLLGIILLNRKIISTQLLYKANLSPQMFKDYQKELLEKGLINITRESKKKDLNGDPKGQVHKTFNLTELGRQYLEDYRVVDNFIEKYG